MSCCGNNASAAEVARLTAQGPGPVTGYAVDVPGGQSYTYLVQAQAESVRLALGVEAPVRPVHG